MHLIQSHIKTTILQFDSKDARLLEPPSYHNTLLFVRLALGNFEEQVENTWSIWYAPLATMTTRAPQAIYL
jgi:hypothetical protein